MLKRIFFYLTNTIPVNNLLIYLGLDHLFTSRFGIYKRIKINKGVSLQEMAGFSHRAEVQEAIDKTHSQLKETIQKYAAKGDHILDIGCGAGAYLKPFETDYRLTGIDLHPDMVEMAKKTLPGAEIIQNDFLNHDFNRQFKVIYSISVLEFIPPGQLSAFFRKVHLLLAPEGKLFLHYPHALRFKDTLYPDLYYVEYSPRKINHALRKNFNILTHEHGYDGRVIDLYDSKPYEPGIRTFKNGYLLIAETKGKKTL